MRDGVVVLCRIRRAFQPLGLVLPLRAVRLEFFAGWLTEYINGGEHVNVPEIPTLFSLAVIVVAPVITTLVASLYKTRVVEKG